MPPITKITKEKIIDVSMRIVKNEGIELINARRIAKELNCSTQPIFSCYKNMDELKSDIYKAVISYYNSFIMNYVDESDYLFTISIAYEEFARLERNYFTVMFLSKLQKSRTVDEVINSKWNRDTIEAITKQYNIDLNEAEGLYRDVRFYTHGIALQIHAGATVISLNEVKYLIRNIIDKLLH